MIVSAAIAISKLDFSVMNIIHITAYVLVLMEICIDALWPLDGLLVGCVEMWGLDLFAMSTSSRGSLVPCC